MGLFSRNRVVIVDQSNANIRIAHAKEVNAHQIGANINNYGSGEYDKSGDGEVEEDGTGRNISIGVVNWSDFGIDSDVL